MVKKFKYSNNNKKIIRAKKLILGLVLFQATFKFIYSEIFKLAKCLILYKKLKN